MGWAVQSLDVPFALSVTLSAPARCEVNKSIQQPANLGQAQCYSLNASRVFAAAAFISVSSVPQKDVMMYTPSNAKDAQLLQYPWSYVAWPGLPMPRIEKQMRFQESIINLLECVRWVMTEFVEQLLHCACRCCHSARSFCCPSLSHPMT